MPEVKLHGVDFKKIKDSGQVFRMWEPEDGVFYINAIGRRLKIESKPHGVYVFHCPDEEYKRIWTPYFDLDTDYSHYLKCIRPEDDYLLRAVSCGLDMKILRQDPWETLVSFIISQRKNIPAIQKSIELLSKRFGERKDSENGEYYAFPTPEALANAALTDLRACSLGYRDEYVHLAARSVAGGELNLESLRFADSAELKDALTGLRGVGEKVANCVMLFGYHKLDAFPVDTWIRRVIDTEYGGDFPPESYKRYAGVLQQYIFYYARKMKGR